MQAGMKQLNAVNKKIKVEKEEIKENMKKFQLYFK